MQPNWQLFLTQLFLNETLHSRIEAPACVHKEIGDQNGKVPRRMIRLHTYLCYEMSGSRPGYCSSHLAGRMIFFHVSVQGFLVLFLLRVRFDRKFGFGFCGRRWWGWSFRRRGSTTFLLLLALSSVHLFPNRSRSR